MAEAQTEPFHSEPAGTAMALDVSRAPSDAYSERSSAQEVDPQLQAMVSRRMARLADKEQT